MVNISSIYTLFNELCPKWLFWNTGRTWQDKQENEEICKYVYVIFQKCDRGIFGRFVDVATSFLAIRFTRLIMKKNNRECRLQFSDYQELLTKLMEMRNFIIVLGYR